MTPTPPAIAPRRPVTCGIAPDRQPRMRATTIRSSVSASIAFTARSSHRPRARALRGSEVAGPPRSGHRHADRLRDTCAVGDRVRAGPKLTEVHDGPFELGEVDAHTVAGPVALAKRDLE